MVYTVLISWLKKEYCGPLSGPINETANIIGLIKGSLNSKSFNHQTLQSGRCRWSNFFFWKFRKLSESNLKRLAMFVLIYQCVILRLSIGRYVQKGVENKIKKYNNLQSTYSLYICPYFFFFYNLSNLRFWNQCQIQQSKLEDTVFLLTYLDFVSEISSQVEQVNLF